jgi:pimeloyl-ACP methyl ester carboxylesterase
MRLAALVPWLLGLLGLYAAWLVVLYLAQRSMVYPGTRIHERPPLAADREDRQILWLETDFGQVEAWYLHPRAGGPETGGPEAGGPAIIIAHGNAELIDSIPSGFLGLRERGYAVLLVEYPGYGDSAGEPSVHTVTQTFITAYDTLAARTDVDAGRILGMGRSLGGGAICALAAQRPLQALLLVSSFADLPSMSRRYLAPAWLASERYDNESVLRTYNGPVFIAHGTRDELIGLEHARRNRAAATRSLLVTYDARHDECPVDFVRFWRDVDTFLAQELAPE